MSARGAQAAWEIAEQEERNQLARALFEHVRVLGDQIVSVKPREAFAPFFRLNYELRKENNPAAVEPAAGLYLGRKRRDSNLRLRYGRLAPATGYMLFGPPGCPSAEPPRRSNETSEPPHPAQVASGR
jgi:hypothetical protein